MVRFKGEGKKMERGKTGRLIDLAKGSLANLLNKHEEALRVNG